MPHAVLRNDKPRMLARRKAVWPVGIALALLYACLAALVVAHGPERSGWVLMTHPSEPSHASNSLFGYSLLQGESVLHKENHSFFNQVALFSGAPVSADLYFRRPLFAFLAAHLAPWMGMSVSLLFVNLLAWAAAGYLSYRFAHQLYGSTLAGGWAAAFAIAGFGPVIHTMDLSAHLLSFVLYFAGVVLLYELGVWRRAVPLRTHLLIGMFLAFASWQYNTGLILTAGYLLVGLRYNKLWHLAVAVALALSAQPLWQFFLSALYEHAFHRELPDLSATEREYLVRALGSWARIWSSDFDAALARTFEVLLQFLWYECPVIVALGGAALLLRRDQKGLAWFKAVLIALPFLAGMVFATAAGARGYLVYEVSIFFYAALGGAVSSLRKSGAVPPLVAGAVLLAVQILWNTAHLQGLLGPIKAYFLGMDHASHLFVSGRTAIMSLTGFEPTPYAFGGTASLASAGLVPGPDTATIEPNVGIAFLARSFFILPAVVALTIALPNARRRLTWIGAFLLVEVLAAISSSRVTRTIAVSPILDNAYRLAAPQLIDYRITLSSPFRDRLLAGLTQGRSIQLFAGYVSEAAPELYIGSRQIALRAVEGRWRVWMVDHREVLTSLPETREVRIRFRPPADIGGWQRLGLPGREISGLSTAGPIQTYPAVEIRLMDGNAPILIGF